MMVALFVSEAEWLNAVDDFNDGVEVVSLFDEQLAHLEVVIEADLSQPQCVENQLALPLAVLQLFLLRRGGGEGLLDQVPELQADLELAEVGTLQVQLLEEGRGHADYLYVAQPEKLHYFVVGDDGSNEFVDVGHCDASLLLGYLEVGDIRQLGKQSVDCLEVGWTAERKEEAREVLEGVALEGSVEAHLPLLLLELHFFLRWLLAGLSIFLCEVGLEI